MICYTEHEKRNKDNDKRNASIFFSFCDERKIFKKIYRKVNRGKYLIKNFKIIKCFAYTYSFNDHDTIQKDDRVAGIN